jgi:bifunctional DNA-binding transcriptional regulator/antitoxin component of YhaV-PrlF toxin-antitoxin module
MEALVSTITHKIPAKRKVISISDKRQITIPQEFFKEIGFGKDAICYIDKETIVIKPIAKDGREFSELILADLIKEGLEGEALLDEFIHRQGLLRKSVDEIIEQAEIAANNPRNYTTIDDVFAEEI